MTKMPPKRRIGILGGMGPEATVLLMSRIITMTPAKDDSEHVPLLVDNNTHVPSRIQALIEKSGQDPGPVLVNMALRLEAAGVEALAMPCNTAHHYARQIQSAVSIPLLNMIELSVDEVADAVCLSPSTDSSRIGILASPAVQLTGLFEQACSDRGLKAVYPTDQHSLLACIKSVKANGGGAKARSLLKDAVFELQEAGVVSFLVACTEFSIINDAMPKEVLTIDTMDVLARAVVKFASV